MWENKYFCETNYWIMLLAVLTVIAAGTSVVEGRTGGPDYMGYTFIDSNTPGGPTYNWIDIKATGTKIEVLNNSDDHYTSNGISVGFFFNFYGTDYSLVNVTNNGIIFATVGYGDFSNVPINNSPLHNFIAPFWDDIVTWNSSGGPLGGIYYQVIGTAPNRKFIVEWENNQHYSSSPKGVTFEAILNEGTNDILFQYSDVSFGEGYPGGNNGSSATVGIEGPDGRGLQYSYNEQALSPGLAILYKFPAFSGTNMYLSKSAAASMDHGNTMNYTLYFNNFGSVVASDVVLLDTLPSNVEFVSASDGGTFDSNTRNVTWNIGSVAVFPSGRGSRTVTVRIPTSVPIGTVIQNIASISTTTLETRYDDNSASASTTVTGSNLPPGVGISPINGNSGGTPSVYWSNPITYSYQNPTAIGVNITIHIDDGGSDITGSMTGGPPVWTYTTTFYPRHGHATVTYTVNDPTPYSSDFDLQNMHGYENTITAAEIEDYIRNARKGAYRNSPMLQEAGIGERFITAGRNNNVNPSFLVATAELEGRFGVSWDNNGDGVNDNWAYTNSEAHNTMGWGVPLGSTPMNSINTCNSWGDCIERVAQHIAAPNDHYYGSGLRTVHDIRGVYVGGQNNPNYASVPFIVNFMNNLASHAGQAGEFNENFSIYIDPAGYIYDAGTGARISGATVWLQHPDGSGGWENVPTGQNPPISQPDTNPLITGIDGQYQWDVLAGSYRVHVEAAGYNPAESIVVSIPPPVTDLHVGLIRIPGVPFLNSIEVSPSAKTLMVGDNFTFTASPKDQNGDPFTASVNWSSSNLTVGTIDASGKFIASNPGTAMVNASNGSVTGTAIVTVNSVIPSLTIEVSPPAKTLSVGDNFTFAATALDQNGGPIEGINVSWTNSNMTVGTVSPDDAMTDANGKATTTFTAIANGTSMVNATNGSVAGSADVVVKRIFEEINLIKNPSFESGRKNWIFYTNGTGRFNVISPGFEGNNASEVTIMRVGSNMQLYQKKITLNPNTHYRLSFAAKSSTGHDVTVVLLKHGSPFTKYGLAQNFNLTEDWQTFTTEFDTEHFTRTVNDGRLMFYLAPWAKAGDKYYFDSVMLEEIQ